MGTEFDKNASEALFDFEKIPAELKTAWALGEKQVLRPMGAVPRRHGLGRAVAHIFER